MLQKGVPSTQILTFKIRTHKSPKISTSTRFKEHLHHVLPCWTFYLKNTLDGAYVIYDPGSRFATTPPPPHGMVPKPAFCSIPHENVVFAMFFAWWVAGAVRNPANSLDFCNQPSENLLFAMFRLRPLWSSAAAPSSISVSNHYHIILNLLPRVFSLGTGLISVYILCLSNFLLECLVFRNWSNLKLS